MYMDIGVTHGAKHQSNELVIYFHII